MKKRPKSNEKQQDGRGNKQEIDDAAAAAITYITPSQPGELDMLETSMGGPMFAKNILPILNKLFTVRNTSCTYFLISTGQMIGAEGEVRRWLCEHGIPSPHLLTPDEYAILELWAKYTHVLPSDFLKHWEQYTDADVFYKILIAKMNVRHIEGDSYATENGSFSGTVEDLRERMRWEGGVHLFGRRMRGISPVERTNLRVWAARSLRPLPGGRLGESGDKLKEEESISSGKVMIQKTECGQENAIEKSTDMESKDADLHKTQKEEQKVSHLREQKVSHLREQKVSHLREQKVSYLQEEKVSHIQPNCLEPENGSKFSESDHESMTIATLLVSPQDEKKEVDFLLRHDVASYSPDVPLKEDRIEQSANSNGSDANVRAAAHHQEAVKPRRKRSLLSSLWDTVKRVSMSGPQIEDDSSSEDEEEPSRKKTRLNGDSSETPSSWFNFKKIFSS